MTPEDHGRLARMAADLESTHLPEVVKDAVFCLLSGAPRSEKAARRALKAMGKEEGRVRNYEDIIRSELGQDALDGLNDLAEEIGGQA